MVIDSHQHFWNYRPAEFGWIDESMEDIARDFLPEQLYHEMEAAGVQGVVSVQARQSLQETEWLLQLAREQRWIVGIVGWVPLVEEDVAEHLARFAEAEELKAVRHVVHDEPDDQFILRDDFNRGVAMLESYNLAYDILVFERHLPAVVEFVDRHPNQRFVLDHLGKPCIAQADRRQWQACLGELARRPNVYCKLSGMVTEADWQAWTADQLRPYFDAALLAFGPERLMFGSDWPVCLLASSYARWIDLVRTWTSTLSPDEQARIFGGTAAEAYRLEVRS